MKSKFKIGDTVVNTCYNYTGTVEKIYTSWEDLKYNSEFITLDDKDMDFTERLINGDPRDIWLKIQEKPYSQEQLEENWYSISCFSGGSIWTSESRLKLIFNYN